MKDSKGLALTFTFVAGVVLGSVATWTFAKKKYESIIQVEIDSARKTYNDMAKKLAEKNVSMKEELAKVTPVKDDPDDKDVDDYTKIVEDAENGNLRTVSDEEILEGDEIELTEEPSTDEETLAEPKLIEKEEFATLEDFGYDTLTFYKGDHTLTDSLENVIEDMDGTVGEANLEKFGYLADDPYTIYVRNPQKKFDYEVLLEERSYAVKA